MKTYLTFVLGILLGIVIGFVIFTTTPIGLRYKHMTVSDFSLVRYDTWSGKASILSGEILGAKYERSSNTGLWVSLPSSTQDEFSWPAR